MRVFSVYLSRFLGLRVLAVLFALTALLVMKELIENIEGLLDRRGSILDLLIFLQYRVPTVIESVIPVSVLIGTVVGFRNLSNKSEMVALWSAGISNKRIFLFCMPLCILVVVSHHLIAGRIVPSFETSLSEWRDSGKSKDELVWLNGNNNFVKIGQVSQNGENLTDVTVFLDDISGKGISKIKAAFADYTGNGWLLRDVETIAGDPVEIGHSATLDWPEGPSPETLTTLAAKPEHLNNKQLKTIVAEQWSSALEQYVYETTLARRAVIPLSSVLMMLLAIVTLRGQNRGSGPQVNAAVSIVLGLGYVILDGFFSAMGRAGLIAPEFAAWSALVLFLFAASMMLLRYER